MKASYLLLLVPCAVLAACNRAETPGERSDTTETPMSSPDTRDNDTGTSAIGIDQNGNATVNPNTPANPNTGVTGTGTGTPGTGTGGATSSGTSSTTGAGTTGTSTSGTNTTRPDGGSADEERRNQ